MTREEAQSRYPLEDWVTDLDAILAVGAMVGNLPQLVEEQFRRYKETAFPAENPLRVQFCLAWVKDNFYPLRSEGAFEVNPAGYKLTDAAITALYRMFMGIRAEDLGKELDNGIAVFVSLVRDQKDWNEDRG